MAGRNPLRIYCRVIEALKLLGMPLQPAAKAYLVPRRGLPHLARKWRISAVLDRLSMCSYVPVPCARRKGLEDVSPHQGLELDRTQLPMNTEQWVLAKVFGRMKELFHLQKLTSSRALIPRLDCAIGRQCR